MRFGRISLVFVLVTAVGFPAAAQMRELGQDEVRENVRTGQSVPLSRIMSIVSGSVDGEIVDVRVFEGGGIFYRVLIKQRNGRLGSVVLNGRSGGFMRADSSVTQSVVNAARSSQSSNAGIAASANRNNFGGGKGNANSNASSNNAGGGGGGNAGSGNSGGGNSGGGNSGGGNSGGGNSGGGNSGGGNSGGGNSGGGNSGGGNGNK